MRSRCITCGNSFERASDESWKARCHPDKHGGSELANNVTAWLLRVHKEVRV